MNFFERGDQQSNNKQTADFVVDSTNAEVALPPSFNIATVQFDRAGPDLIITSADGEEILVTNYFASGSQPAITLPNGVTLPTHIVQKLAGPVAPNQFAQVGQVQGLEPIGTVETADGQVEAVRADGTRVSLKVGDPVFQGDELVTGEDGAVGVVFADETTFALGEDGRMLLDEMVYDPGAQDGQIGMTLLTGAMTFVSGAVAKVNPDAMQITTPVATIGIRGTAGVLKVLGEQLDAVMLPELAGNGGDVDPNQANNGVVSGEFIITNNNGETVTVNQPLQGVTSTPNGNSAPRVFSMDEIGAMAGKTLASLPNGDNLLPQSIVSAANNEQGNQQQDQLNPEDVLVDNNTADLLEGITQQTQSALSNLATSTELAQKTVAKISKDADDKAKEIEKEIERDSAQTQEQAQSLLSVADNVSGLSVRASTIEKTAGENSGAKDVEANAQRISVEWTSDTTDSLEDSVDNVAEAYATANAIGAIATGVSDFTYVVAKSLKSFADPVAVVELVDQVDATLTQAMNEAEYIVTAMTLVQDAASNNPDLSLSVKDRMVEAVVRAAKFVKDNNGTDAQAIEFAREVVVNGVPANGQMTFNGVTGDVYKFYDGIKVELDKALAFSGHADAFDNLDSNIATLNTLFNSLKSAQFNEGSAYEAKWQAVVDELLALTDYTQEAATQAKAVVNAGSIADMDQAAGNAVTAQNNANSKVQDSSFDNLMNEMGDLVGANAPSIVLSIADQFLSKASAAETATFDGSNNVLNFFNRTQKDINEDLLAGQNVTQADIDAATEQLNEVKSDLATSKTDLSTAQSAFETASSTLSTAADNVVSALIAFKTAEAKRDVYIAGAQKINDGTLYNGTDHFNVADGSGIDGLQEAKDFVTHQEAELVTAQAAYDTAVDNLNNEPDNITLARAVLVAQQEMNKFKTLIDFGNKLVATWQEQYDVVKADADTYTTSTQTLQDNLTAAENAEQTAREDLLLKLDDFITAQEDVSNESKVVAVFESNLANLIAQAEQEGKQDLDDAFADARALLDNALAQAEIAADKASEANQKMQAAQSESDPTVRETLLTEAQSILSDAEAAKNVAKQAFDDFTMDLSSNPDDNVLARAIDIRDNYPRPPSEIDQVISGIESLQVSVQSAYNEALKQVEAAGHSVDVIQAIVDNDAAAQAAAEQAAQAAADAAKTQALQAALEKAQAAQKDIEAALQEAQSLKAGSDVIAQNSIGTSEETAAANQATFVSNQYDQIVAKQVLVAGDNNTTGLVEQVQAAQAAGDLALARSLAQTAQTYAKDVITIVEGTTSTDGLRNIVAATAKDVIDVLNGEVGTRDVDSTGVEVAGSRDGLLKLSADKLALAKTEYDSAYDNENDTTAANGVESVFELFSPTTGQSIVSAILATEVTADELLEFGGTDVAGYVPIYTRLENLKAAVIQSSTLLEDALSVTGQYVETSADLAQKAREILDAANMKGTDFTAYASKVEAMGRVSGMIADENGKISSAAQRIEQIQKALELYDTLWDARVQAAKDAADAKAAAETAAQEATDLALERQQRQQEQKQAEDDVAEEQAKGFRDTAETERDLAETAKNNAEEAAINGDEDSARQYWEQAQTHAANAQSAASAATDAASGHGTTAEGYADSARDYYETASGYVGTAKAAVTTAGDATTAANNWRSGAATTSRIQAEADKVTATDNETAAETALSEASTKLVSARTAVGNAEVDKASAQAAYNSLRDSEQVAKEKAAAILNDVGGDSDHVLYQAWNAAYQAAVDATKNALDAVTDATQALTDANSRLSVAQTVYDNALSAAEQASEQLANAVSDAAFATASEELGRAVTEAQVEFRLASYQGELDSALSKIDTEKQDLDTLASTAAQHSKDDGDFNLATVENAYDDPNSTNDAVGLLAEAQTAKASADTALSNAQQTLARYHVDIAAANADIADDNTHTIKNFADYNNDATWVKIDATTVIHSSTFEKYQAAQKSIELAEQKAAQAAQALEDVQAKVTEIAQSLDKANAIAAENELDNATSLQVLQDGADAALSRAEGSAENAIDSAYTAINSAKNALLRLETIVGNDTHTQTTESALDDALNNIGTIQTIADDWGTSAKAATQTEIDNVIDAFGQVGGDAGDLLVQLKNALSAFDPANFTGTANQAALQVQSALQALVDDGANPTGGVAGFALSAVQSLSQAFDEQGRAHGSGSTGQDTNTNGIDDGLENAARLTAGHASDAAGFAEQSASQTVVVQGANKNVASIQSNVAQDNADTAAKASVQADLDAIIESANAAQTSVTTATTQKDAAVAAHTQAAQDVATTKGHMDDLQAKAEFGDAAKDTISGFDGNEDSFILHNASHLSFVETPYSYDTDLTTSAEIRSAINADSSVASNSLLTFQLGGSTFVYAKVTSADPYADFFVELNGFTGTLNAEHFNLSGDGSYQTLFGTSGVDNLDSANGEAIDGLGGADTINGATGQDAYVYHGYTDLASKAEILNELNDAKAAYQAAQTALLGAENAKNAAIASLEKAEAARDAITAEIEKVAKILDANVATDFQTFVDNFDANGLSASFFVDDSATVNTNESDLDGDGISNAKEISNAQKLANEKQATADEQQKITEIQKDKAESEQANTAQSASDAQSDLAKATTAEAVLNKSEEIADNLVKANVYAVEADKSAQTAQDAATQAKAKSQLAAEKTVDGSLSNVEKIAQARQAANDTHAEQAKTENAESSALTNFNLAFAALIAAYDVVGDPNSQLNSLTSAYNDMSTAIANHSATDSTTIDSAANASNETAEADKIGAYETAFNSFVDDLKTELNTRVTNSEANTLQKDLILNTQSAVSDAFEALKETVEAHAIATKSAINAEVTADQAETDIGNAIQTAVNAYEVEADTAAKEANDAQTKAQNVHNDNDALTTTDAFTLDSQIKTLTGSIQNRLTTLENDLLAKQGTLGNDLYINLKSQLDLLKAAVTTAENKSTQIESNVDSAADAATTAAQNAQTYADKTFVFDGDGNATVDGVPVADPVASAKEYATQAASYAQEAQNQLNIAQAHRSNMSGLYNEVTALEQGYTQLSNLIDAKISLAEEEAAANAIPVALDDTISTNEDQTIELDDLLLSNDYRNDGQPVTILDVGTPNVGTIVKNAQGKFEYTPPADYNGQVTFSYLITTDSGKIASANVTLNVVAVNDAPVAVNDVASTINEVTPVTINLLANDIDPDNADVLTLTSIGTQPIYGTLTILNNGVGGRVVYTPDPDNAILKALGAQEVQQDTFTYIVSDSSGASSTATATITVTGTNDLPTVTSTQLNTDEDTAIILDAASFEAGFSDIDGDNLSSVRITQLPQTAVTDAQGVTTYQSSGSLILNGSAVEKGQEIAVADLGNLIFTPAQNFYGTITIGWQASDGETYDNGTKTIYSEAEATLSLTVNPVNDPVVLANGGTLSGSTAEDTVYSGTITASDVDGDTLTYSVAPGYDAASGTVSLNTETGTFTYTPDANFNGNDSFQITVSDGNGSQVNATVNVTVAAVNDSPSDITLDQLTIDEGADGGVVGTLATVDPDSGDTFIYTVSDNRFEVVGNQLKLKSGIKLDFETPADQSFTLTVTSTDSGALSYNKDFTITTNDVNEAPNDIALSNLNVAEDLYGVAVGEISVTDPDAGDSFTYSVNDNRFEVIGNQLVLKPGEMLDYDNPADRSFQIDITAQDNGGLTFTKTFTITTQDTLETPVVNGIAGEAASLVFDGVETFVNVGRGTADSLEIIDDLTIETWLKLDQLGGDQTILAFGGAGETANTNNAYQLYIDSDGDVHYAHEYGAGQDVDLSFATGLQTGEWHQIALVRDHNGAGQSDVTLYMDGIAVGTQSYAGATEAPASASEAILTVGNVMEGGAPFIGEIMESRIWSDIRSEAEITAFQHSNLPASEIADPALRGYWDFAGVAKDEKEYLEDLSTYDNHIYAFDGFTFDGTTTATSYGNIQASNHSASVWARVAPISDGEANGDVTIFSMDDGLSSLDMKLTTYGEIALSLSWDSGNYEWTVDSASYPQFAGMDDGMWHNLAYSFDPNSGVTLFVDGQQVPGTLETGSGDYSTFNLDAAVMIGGNSSDTNLNMVGDLSGLGIYDGVLSASEVQSIIETGPYGLSANDVLAYWHMDDGSGYSFKYDSYGYSNSNDMTASISGNENWVNETPGINAYSYQALEVGGPGVQLGSHTLNSNEFSASMWVKIDDAGNGVELFTLGGDAITVRAISDYIEVKVGDSFFVQSNDGGQMGEWMNISFSYDGADLKLYIGDDNVQTITGTYDLLEGQGSHTLSALLGGITPATFGAVQIWNSVLTQPEFEAASHGVVNLSDPALLGYWPMTDDSASSIIQDLSSYEQDATLVGAQFVSGLPTLQDNSAVISIEEDDSFVSRILVEDADQYGASLTYQVQTAPQHGTIELKDDGSFIYIPAANYTGADNFTVVALNSGSLVSAPYNVNLNIYEYNEPPYVEDDEFDILVNSSDNILTVLTNDSDQDGDPLTITAINGSSDIGPHEIYGGYVTLVNGEVSFTPLPDFVGVAYFDYQVSDGQGGTRNSHVTLNISSDYYGTDNDDTMPVGTNANESFHAQDGNDIMQGSGGDDYFDGGAGIDTISYAGSSDGVTVDLNYIGSQFISYAQGNDSLDNIENIDGSAFNDTLFGNYGDNAIIGADGDDIINGSQGADTLDGGNGKNIYLYEDKYASTQGASDIILSLNPDDKIVFVGMRSMTFISTTATDEATFLGSGLSSDTVYYVDVSSGNNFIYVSGVGTGTDYDGTMIHFDTGVTAPTADQILADDYPLSVMQGTDGNETINGDSASNTLVGLMGDDTLQGGAGDDHYIVSGGTDHVIDNVGVNHIHLDGDRFDVTNMYRTGTDEFKISLSDYYGPHEFIVDGHYSNGNDAFVHLGMDGMETVYKVQTNVTVTPGESSILISEDATNETLTGSTYDDILVGQSGDTLLGDGGYDMFIVNEGVAMIDGGDSTFADEASFMAQSNGVMIDLENNVGQHSDGVSTFGIMNIQNITASNFDDVIVGNADSNYLWGADGDDTMFGGAGNDVLEGGEGADLLSGGAGNDIFEFFGSSDSDENKTDIIVDFVSGEDKISFAQYGENMKFYGSYGYSDDPSGTVVAIQSDENVETGEVVWFHDDANTFVYVKDDGSLNGGTFIALAGFTDELTINDFAGVGTNIALDASADVVEQAVNQPVVISLADVLTNDKGTALTITHVNAMPINDVLNNDLFVNNGTLSFDGTNFSFIPNVEFKGEVKFDLSITGTEGNDTSILTLRFDEQVGVVGTVGDDLLNGSSYEDNLIGLDGDDTFYGGAADDFIVGGEDSGLGDVANYDHASGDYAIGLQGSALTVSDQNAGDGDEGRDHLLGIEKLYFDDLMGGSPHGLNVTYETDRLVDDSGVVADTVSKIAYLLDGSYVEIHRQSSNDFIINRFNADGTAYGAMAPITIASTMGMPGETANIQATVSGGFSVVWSASDGGIYYKEFDGTGSVVDPEGTGDDFLVSDSLIETELNNPNVVTLANGDTVVAYSAAGTNAGYYIRTLPVDGIEASMDTSIQLETFNSSDESASSLIALSGGGYAYLHTIDNGNGTFKTEVVVDNGGPLRTEIENSTSLVTGMKIVELANGRLLTVWESAVAGSYGATNIQARILESDGSIVVDGSVTGRDVFDVNFNSVDGGDFAPDVAVLSNGNFVVVWTNLYEDGDGGAIWGQVFDQDGNSLGDDFLINSTVHGSQYNPSVSANENGTFVVSWTDEQSDTNTHQISAQQFNNDGSLESGVTITGDGTVDVFIGGDGRQVFIADDGDDIIDGGNGLDGISYASFGEEITADLMNNQVSSTTMGTDTISNIEGIIATNFADILMGDTQDNKLNGMGAEDTISGNAGDDHLIGGAGNDILIGGDGIDVLDGGAGNDTFVFNASSEYGDLITTFETGDFIELSSALDGLNGISISDWLAEAFEFGIHTVTDVGEGAQLSGSGPSIYVYANSADDSGTVYYDADGAGAGYSSTKIADIGSGASNITAEAIKIV